jgi:hypothetical protein
MMTMPVDSGAEAPCLLPPEGSVDIFPAQANREIRKAGRGAICTGISCFPAFQMQK